MLALFALWAFAPLAQRPQPDAMEYLREHRQAHAALISGKLPEARAGFERCLVISPFNATVAYELACVEARGANVDEALGSLERAVAWGYPDADVAVWDNDLANLRQEKRFDAALQRMRKLKSNCADNARYVRIWDDGDCDLTLDLAVDPGGRFVALAQYSGVVRLVDARTGHALRSPVSLHSPVWALDVDKSGEHIAALTWDGKLHLWSIAEAGEPTSTDAIDAPLAWERLDAVGGARVQFDPSGVRLLVGAEFRGASLWSSSGEKICAWNEQQCHRVQPTWSPDGERIAYSDGRSVHFARASDGMETEAPFTTASRIWSIAFQPGGELFATGHADNTLRVWELKSRRQIFAHRFTAISERRLRVHAAAFSPDGEWIAGGVFENGQVGVFNARTGAEVATGEGEIPFDEIADPLVAEQEEPHEFAWSPDSQRVWFASLRGGAPLREITLDRTLSPSLSFYGRAPRAGSSDQAFASCMRGVLALDSASGSCRWNRPNLARDGEILKTAAGYFTTDLECLEGFTVDPGGDGPFGSAGRLLALTDCAELLFDPKRVRAARDGVPIVPARL